MGPVANNAVFGRRNCVGNVGKCWEKLRMHWNDWRNPPHLRWEKDLDSHHHGGTWLASHQPQQGHLGFQRKALLVLLVSTTPTAKYETRATSRRCDTMSHFLRMPSHQPRPDSVPKNRDARETKFNALGSETLGTWLLIVC